ncbi:MAG: hypothetical protein WC374_01205 [Phycisphaerae bacterium]|jgi:DNA-binding NarL/FixJ family response regulator
MQEHQKGHHEGSYLRRRFRAVAGNVLILNPNTACRKMLACLLNEMLDIKQCFESESIESALSILDSQTVDFAIVDASSSREARNRWVESLKLRCPMLPVMSVSILPADSDSNESMALISLEQTQRIMAAVRYMQTLMRTGLSGFTVFVNAENAAKDSVTNNYLRER